MTYFLPFAVVLPMLAAVLFTETDTAAVHVGERPPPAIKGNGPNLESEAEWFNDPLIAYAATTERTESPAPSPTTTPEPIAPPAPSQRVHAATAPSDIEAIICSYDWDCGTALRVAFCESRYHPDSTNGIMLGLYQISDYDPASGWQGWWRYFGFDSARYVEPAYNVELAYLIWQESGWDPWQCY